ncbi:hypothetical protein BKA62DRAFT_350529 [Auriculariales sp. MPI-PUGE-AT-0066]|nr:hypothetical protein BKA62DRAFT_350529 [Auriculariales sp. MPI-PUGE-AT-0066]
MQNMKPKTLAKRLRNASASAVGTPVFASAFDAQMTSNATSGAPYTRPPFPSLYDPSFEGSGDYAFEHGLVLLNSIDIYQFTLYWHLILIIPVFVMPGVWAVAMLALSTVRSRRITRQRTGNMRGTGSGRRTSWYQSGRRMSWYRSSDSGPHSSMMGTPSVMISRMPAKPVHSQRILGIRAGRHLCSHWLPHQYLDSIPLESIAGSDDNNWILLPRHRLYLIIAFHVRCIDTAVSAKGNVLKHCIA